MLKQIMKRTVTAILQWEARLVLRRFKPSIIAVTGSVGKTSTKDAIYSVLARSFYVRKSEKSFNSELGVPLTILGCPNAWNSPAGWISNIIAGFFVLFEKSYPKWLVLEIGADRPGDIKKIAQWLRIEAAVITRFAKVPVHVEFFSSPREVIEEKSKIIDALIDDGVLILNSDDDDVLALKDASRSKVFAYGFGVKADLRASNDQIIYEERNGKRFPIAIAAKINYAGSSIPFGVRGGLGRPKIYAALAAIAVGISQGLNLVEMVETLSEKMEMPNGRLRLLDGVKNTVILDDTYNSSPVAVEESLGILKSLEISGRKIAVLGDMMELGKYSVNEHEKAGAQAAFADMLITVGIRAKHFADGARKAGYDENKIFEFEDSLKAGEYLDEMIQEGDVILVKGSQSIRMERTVEEIMANPEEKEKLLVRQDKEWLQKK